MAQITYPEATAVEEDPQEDTTSRPLFRLEYRVGATVSIDIRAANGIEARSEGMKRLGDLLDMLEAQDGVRLTGRTTRRQSVWKNDG